MGTPYEKITYVVVLAAGLGLVMPEIYGLNEQKQVRAEQINQVKASFNDAQRIAGKADATAEEKQQGCEKLETTLKQMLVNDLSFYEAGISKESAAIVNAVNGCNLTFTP